MNTQLGVVRAEVLKLVKRPAARILGLIVVLIPLVIYAVNYLTATGEDETARVIARVSPGVAAATALDVFAQFGPVVAVIFGALTGGNEYGWGTIRTISMQRASRTHIVIAKIIALVVVFGVVVLGTLVAAWGSASLATGLLEAPVDAPRLLDFARAFGVGLVILATWSTLGILLSVALRGAAQAIALGLVYALLIESILLGLPQTQGILSMIRSGSVLTNTWASVTTRDTPNLPAPSQAVAVLLVEALIFTVLGVVIIRRQELR